MLAISPFEAFEEGWPRRFKDVTLPQVIGAAGEVKPWLRQVSDLPRCALFKLARHFVNRAQRPLLEGGEECLVLGLLNFLTASPSAPSKVASRHFINGAATPPNLGG